MNYVREKDKPKNLLEWFYYVFGRAITEKYLKPYNEKLWKTDLRKITLEWVGNRVPNPPVEDILKSCVGIPTEGYKHQLRFYYPLEGGIETLARNLAKHCNIVTNERIERIERDGEKFILKGKREYVCDKVVSTAPIDVTARMLGMKVKLSYNPLTVVGIGGKGDLPDFHWVYVPDDDVIFHRVAFLHNYSPNMAPENRINIIAEVSGKAEVDEVLEGLERIGFDVEPEICLKWEWDYAYIVYDESYSQVEEIRRFLIENGVIPFGRFGNWEYLNMDAVWIKAKKLAREL
jgi:protoporphyrinogen oxidase